MSIQPLQTNSIRIMIVDDHAMMRAGLKMIIQHNPSFEVVCEATCSSDALSHAARETLDIILLDLDLGDESGLNLLPILRSTARGARVIVLTGLRDRESHRTAVRLGAMGIVLKEHTSETLIKAIKKVHEGEAWLDRGMVGSLLNEINGHTTPLSSITDKALNVTQREWDVVELICEGLSNRGISERLSISETTVRHHLSSVFDKLGVTSRLELVIFVYRHNLLKSRRSTNDLALNGMIPSAIL